MARATIKESPIEIELSAEEASALFTLLATEQWPQIATEDVNRNSVPAAARLLNRVYGALAEVGVGVIAEYDASE